MHRIKNTHKNQSLYYFCTRTGEKDWRGHEDTRSTNVLKLSSSAVTKVGVTRGDN